MTSFVCLLCGKIFVNGVIYSNDNHLYEAKKYIQIHIAEEHGSPFHFLTFTFEILETIKPEETQENKWRKAVFVLEDKWLDKLQPYSESGYNKQRN